MTALSGTNLSSSIKPWDSTDDYATHESQYGKGGWREVDTYDDLALIPEPRRSIGMAVYVITEGNLYVLKTTGWEKFSAGYSGTVKMEFSLTGEETQVSLTHNMGKYPSVHVYDTANTEYFVDVRYDDTNTVTLIFKGTYKLEKGIVYFN